MAQKVQQSCQQQQQQQQQKKPITEEGATGGTFEKGFQAIVDSTTVKFCVCL